jgi:glucose 1-dehydrogenase/3-oxoacyl-[acyl-carrier protein] reductase
VAVNFVTGPEPVQGKDNRADAAALVAEFEGAGGRAVAVEADVSDGEAVRRMVSRVSEALGTVDILVNNAGIETIVPLLEMTEAQYQRVLDVNLKGEWLCAQAVARELIGAGKPGAIVNIASIQSGMALPGRSHYAPSKRGVEALTRNLAAELAPHRIRVNCINPGLIATDMTDWVMKDPQILPIILDKIPLHRAGDPDEIAKAVLFFASEDASYVTGQCLYVDGGWIVT